MNASQIVGKIAEIEGNEHSVAYIKAAQLAMQGPKHKYNHLRNLRLRKATLLKELEEQLQPADKLCPSVQLSLRLEDTKAALGGVQMLIEDEENMRQTYKHMLAARNTESKIKASRYMLLKDTFKQTTKKLKDSRMTLKLVEKELERFLGEEVELETQVRHNQYEQDEQFRKQLLYYKEGVESEVWIEKTMSRRNLLKTLESKVHRIYLLEHNYFRAKKIETLDLKLSSCNLLKLDKERKFLHLKKIMGADTAEQIIFNYEDTLRRNAELSQIKSNYEALIESKKKEIIEMKIERNLLRGNKKEIQDISNLESIVVYRELREHLMETDLLRLESTAAQVKTFLQLINSRLELVESVMHLEQ